ncbi:3-hydroxyacyl-CoA dehydrogenase family protein [Vibrio nigripulchritudo]|uniref:3-hydroxyacyl-CoA dehydrogenase family protein n=1 Tax=Vibrio nigripulchritudo TaxID=28173 RepID=UPI0005FA482E|nr:3-hydroxyacyl-CoA dehydrogenase NAD-binding domain-containing protein [Vibrio nigripulchritudo]KJY78348.1 3-hydroxybutyryl-CoA dehydrogenase [Vibrio nigripulchritudo]
MGMKTVSVIGAGQMGQGIAQVFAMAGFNVLLNDQNAAALVQGLVSIEQNLRRSEEKGKLDEPKELILGRIASDEDINKARDSDVIIEAIAEDEDLKYALFQQLDHICPPHTIFASNTSSISITRLASKTTRPHQVIGLHFMNPVPKMELVEVISGMHTTERTSETIIQLIKDLGKTAVKSADKPGFIVNRILIPMINEAICALDDGLASAQEIDKSMTLGAAHPLGPLSLADLIGLDTCLNIMNVLYDGFGDPKYRPSPLLKQMVDGNLLGRKSGQGFFQY